jgi:hypothetical protein
MRGDDDARDESSDGATDGDGIEIEMAIFPCSLCEKPATIIRLTADGDVVIDGLVCRTTLRATPRGLPRLRAILEELDARGLYALDAEWASFYCPDCGRSYCSNHWQFETRYDDDFPGWYDCTYGTCPAGHRRLVDD